MKQLHTPALPGDLKNQIQTDLTMALAPHVTFHVVGDAFVDFFCYLEGDWPEQGGDSCLDQPVKAYAGGSSVNTATHLKALLHQQCLPQTSSTPEEEDDSIPSQSDESSVVLQTVFNPYDHYGKILLDHCAQHDLTYVNCQHSSTKGGSVASTGHCVAIVSRGERSFMTHRGCVETFTAQQLDLEKMIDSSEVLHLHIAGYFNLTGFWNGRLQRELHRLREERKRRHPKGSSTISLVTQHDASNEWNAGIDELVPDIDFFIMNELEANKILRRSRKDQVDSVTQTIVDPVNEWISHFSALGPSTHFVVTRGADGAVAFRNHRRIATLHPAIAVKVIDPTGAGDSFTAGFLHGIWSWKQKHALYSSPHSDGEWPPEAIQQGLLWGCAVGTAGVTIRGASVPPPITDILDLYGKQKAKETFTNR